MVSFQLSHLPPSNDSSLLKAHTELILSCFSWHTLWRHQQLSMTDKDWKRSVFLPLYQELLYPFRHLFHAPPGKHMLGSQPHPTQDILRKELKESATEDKSLKSYSAALVALNPDLAGYRFPSPFFPQSSFCAVSTGLQEVVLLFPLKKIVITLITGTMRTRLEIQTPAGTEAELA